MNSQNQYLRMKSLVIPGCLFFFMILVCNPAIAQEQPPKPIQVTVSTLQNLSFGSFIQSGTSGTVTVTPDGLRTASGNLILPNMSSNAVSYTHLRAHETRHDLVCRLLLEKKKKR